MYVSGRLNLGENVRNRSLAPSCTVMTQQKDDSWVNGGLLKKEMFKKTWEYRNWRIRRIES